MPTILHGNLDALSNVDLVRVLFRVDRLNNDTFQATMIEHDDLAGTLNTVNATETSTFRSPHDDPQGELYYVVVVLSVYAFAIVLFIASFVKKSGHDHGISIYMRDLEKVKRLEKRQEKFRFKLQMVHKDKKHRILGDNRAIIEGRRSSEGDLLLNEHNLFIKPADDNSTSLWSLVTLNMDDSMSACSVNIEDRRLTSSAPPSPGVPGIPIPIPGYPSASSQGLPITSNPTTPTGSMVFHVPSSSPGLSRKPSFTNCIATIPEVKIETCE